MRRLPAVESPGVESRRRELKVLFRRADPGKIARVLEQNAEPIRFGPHEASCVHSIYFDDARLSSCAESMAGVSRRVKLRARWYDAPVPDGILYFELKRRVGLVSDKERIPFELSSGFPASYHELERALADQLDDEHATWLALRGEPTMLVSYRRRHFKHHGTGTRITLDWGVRGYEQLGARALTRDWPIGSDGRVIVELKAPVGAELSAGQILAPLRARLTRSSKYVHCCSRTDWPQMPEAYD